MNNNISVFIVCILKKHKQNKKIILNSFKIAAANMIKLF